MWWDEKVKKTLSTTWPSDTGCIVKWFSTNHMYYLYTGQGINVWLLGAIGDKSVWWETILKKVVAWTGLKTDFCRKAIERGKLHMDCSLPKCIYLQMYSLLAI